VLKQTEDLAAAAWREMLAALDAAGRGVSEILDWAKAQSDAILRSVIAAMDAAGRVVSQAIAWAVKAGDAALAMVAEVLVRAGHTVEEILLWVEKDALGGLASIVKGLLAAGATLVDLVAWAATRSVQIVKDVTAALLQAGIAMAQLVTETLAHPGNAIPNLVKAFEQLGKTLKDIINAAVVQPAQDAMRRVLQALKDLGHSALDVLKAAFEIGASAAALAFTLILEWFPGSYRPLTDAERTEAQKVFGSSIPLDQVRVAVLSLPVDLIEWANGGRAFTTMFLINFASWTQVKIEVLMHELTHVWQGLVAGPVYMVEALEAQASSEGYNYGYDNNAKGEATGEGAQDELNAAAGDFNHFNREQQAQIIEHYYVRRFQSNPVLDVTAWQPYADIVHA
jgi:hypothetical protein